MWGFDPPALHFLIKEGAGVEIYSGVGSCQMYTWGDGWGHRGLYRFLSGHPWGWRDPCS